MLDILQLRVHPDEIDQLRLCQSTPHTDCVAAFTVKSPGQIWPVASWEDAPREERVNVRGWFPLLDKIADEFLLWWPKGGCFFVSRDKVTHRFVEDDARGVMFLQLETHRLTVVPTRPVEVTRPGAARDAGAGSAGEDSLTA
jgi:hypothetical protein